VTLKTKLVLAQAPLALALAAIGVLAGVVTSRLGQEAKSILADNYRSVLAAQRMQEALERIDRAALFRIVGRDLEAAETLSAQRDTFERELEVEEANITEPGETEAASLLRARWTAYWRALERFQGLGPAREPLEAAYFAELAPAFKQVKASAEQILSINQDAMARKSARAERRADHFQSLVIAAVLAAAMIGLFSSTALTARLLRPLGVVGAAVRRFGQGDLQVRARVEESGEIGQLAGEFNTMADKLERYRASSLGELLQAQQAAQAAIDGLPDPVVLLDAAGKVSGVNQAAGTLLRIDTEKPTGDPLAGMDARMRAVLERLRAHVFSGKGAYVPRGFEEAVRLATPDGERIFLPRAAPLYSETGTITGAAVVCQDVTRLFRSDELKNNLVATVAHEFRTPLTSLRMAIHLCLEETVGPLTRKQADLLFAARDDCERLQGIVDDLLDLSRIESGRIELRKRRVRPEALIAFAMDVHRNAADDHRVTLRSEVPPGAPEAFGDPDRLQLVFTNLLSNAIRYSGEGAEITIRARPEFAPGQAEAGAHRLESPGWIRFEVQDQGPGIPHEHQAGLFQKFFRVPGSPGGGSGLGLFIARGIVQAHGGTIGVDSEPGKGATFWFTVPAAPEVAAAAA
jgi:signal transduction histidine kinase